MNEGQRLLKNIKKGEKLNQIELSRKLTINPAQLSMYITGRTTMRASTYRTIAARYPQYVEDEQDNAALTDTNLMAVPLVAHYAHAGFVAGFDDDREESLPMIYVNKEEQSGDYYVFEIKGDSMESDIGLSVNDNDKVLALNIPPENWGSLHFKKYLFIIVHDGIACKQITNINEDSGDITCHSLNPTYNDYTINMRDVKRLFYVKKVVERTISL